MFDVRQPLEGLKVEFNGQDLTAAHQSLVAARLQIMNTGNVSITPANTTPADPLGFKVDGGEVIRLSGFEASSEHLRRYAKPKLVNNRVVISSSVIMDPGDYVRFDILGTAPHRRQFGVRAGWKDSGPPSHRIL